MKLHKNNSVVFEIVISTLDFIFYIVYASVLQNVNTVIKGPINTLDILPLARLFRDILAAHFVGKNATTHEGELIAFVTYDIKLIQKSFYCLS